MPLRTPADPSPPTAPPSRSRDVAGSDAQGNGTARGGAPSGSRRDTPEDVLPLEELRRALGRPEMTDEEAAAIRDDLYAWLNRVLDEYFAFPGAVDSRPPSFP